MAAALPPSFPSLWRQKPEGNFASTPPSSHSRPNCHRVYWLTVGSRSAAKSCVSQCGSAHYLHLSCSHRRVLQCPRRIIIPRLIPVLPPQTMDPCARFLVEVYRVPSSFSRDAEGVFPGFTRAPRLLRPPPGRCTGRAGGANSSSVRLSVPRASGSFFEIGGQFSPGQRKRLLAARHCVTERACERGAIGRLKLVPGVTMTFRRLYVPPVQWRWFGGTVAHDTREIQDGREGCKDALSYARPARHGKRKRGP